MSPIEYSPLDEANSGSSDRSFGLVFAGFFMLVGAYRLAVFSTIFWPWLIASAIFGALAIFLPELLRPLNKFWTSFGLLLHSTVGPVTLGILYIVAILPTALLVRVMGKDLLRLSSDPNAPTYWIQRQTADNQSSMINQF